jgi:hypothetical protein
LSFLKGNSTFLRSRFLRDSPSAMTGARGAWRVLSNYLDIEGRPFSSTPLDLRLFELKPKTPQVRYFGDSQLVSPESRPELRSLLEKTLTCEFPTQ